MEKKKNTIKKDEHTDYVYCIQWHDNRVWNETEISSDMKFYPCCALHAEHFLNNTFNDEYLDSLPENWNSVKHNSLKDIMSIFFEHIQPWKWKDEKTCPQCCLGCKYEG